MYTYIYIYTYRINIYIYTGGGAPSDPAPWDPPACRPGDVFFGRVHVLYACMDVWVYACMHVCMHAKYACMLSTLAWAHARTRTHACVRARMHSYFVGRPRRLERWRKHNPSKVPMLRTNGVRGLASTFALPNR